MMYVEGVAELNTPVLWNMEYIVDDAIDLS